MAVELVEDALGDPRNAAALSMASDLAYFPESEGKEKFQEEMGMSARLISVDNTQAYIAQNDDHIVVAFRGTEGPTSIDGLKDWLLTDAVNLLIVPEGPLGGDFMAAGVGARFHQGFIGAINEIWDPVYFAVKDAINDADRPVWVTGHSLGGALAVLAGWMFYRKFVSIHQIYTFGGPMIGNPAASEAIDKAYPNKLFRYVNQDDPVPLLPTLSLMTNEYAHCLTEKKLGEASAAITDLFRGFASRAIDGLLSGNLINEFWENIKGRLDAHSMVNYRALVKQLSE